MLNINHTSYIESQEKPNTLSLFNQIQRKEKSNINMERNIKEKRIFLKNILKKEFPSKHLRTKPLIIEKLELGIHNILFGNNHHEGTFNQTLNHLHFLKKNNPTNNINKKINCGSLVYLSLKELEPNANSRIFYKQKEALLTSNNFHIRNDFCLYNPKSPNFCSLSKSPCNTNLLGNSFTTDMKTNMTIEPNSNFDSEHMKFKSESNYTERKQAIKKKLINLKKNFPKHNIKLNLLGSFPSMRNRKGISSKSTINASQTKNTFIDKESRIRNKLKKEKRRKFNQTIYDKVNELSTSRTLNEKRLFEIIDKSQIREEPISLVIRNDLEQIFDITLKKRPMLGETKKAILQAMKLNNTKNMILDETKNRMIELSDRINKLTDEEALKYAERIAEEYHKNNKQLCNQSYTFSRFKLYNDEKRKSEEMQRERIKSNQRKISCLKNKILKENKKFLKHLEPK